MTRMLQPAAGMASDERTRRDGHGGMGLGFFIAKTLLERSGAQVNSGKPGPPETGAVVRIVWPREIVEMAQAVQAGL